MFTESGKYLFICVKLIDFIQVSFYFNAQINTVLIEIKDISHDCKTT